jgi:hypothetical protein
VKFAVIPTNGRDCLEQCLEAIAPQVDFIYLIRTSPDVFPDFVHKHLADRKIGWAYAYCDAVNISCWWNQGLETVAMLAEIEKKETWDVAVINDDVIVPPGWFDAVAEGMRRFDCAAACSGAPAGVSDSILMTPVAVPLETRMQGFAFMLAGEKGLRANEDLHWYFTDDYIDWESRKLGGMNMVGGYPVQHLYPNGQVTPEIHAQIARDAQTFVDIYGRRPW